ncbi:MAG TPA: cysteine--tRNA ligase [Erysipelotrichaceae bacterium]|nr:cysteine--tRNA ligase [Erysipelotrichaceae bacterium]
MRIYNSLSNKIEDFKPIKDGEVSMYVCGPTVYDDPHIGNARPLIVFDLVYRFLSALSYKVTYVSNYTDIDDKIINKANELNVVASVVSEKYIKRYEELSQALNIKTPKTIKVTDTINEIIKYIENLINKGFAYEIDGDVYFRVDKVDDYGKLSGQKIDDLLVGARIDENLKKENPLDFTLWKATTVGTNYASPWSMGRPGWHTECVVMIKDSFKTGLIDIHGGGLDLKFPHHENEIAQASVCSSTSLANYWMHNGLVTLGDKKMSKSEGEMILAKDMVEDLGADLVRWIILSSHYRAPLKLTEELIAQSKVELERINQSLNQALAKVVLNGYRWNEKVSHKNLALFYEALMDDFNTANGYTVIFDTVKILNQLLRVKDVDYQEVVMVANSIIMMLDILGIIFKPISITMDDIHSYKLWQAALAKKDFEVADKFRNKLSEKGLI